MRIATCASNAPRHPQDVTITQVAQVAEICEEVVGFEPTEPLVDTLWPGDRDPSSATNNYRGCIASLSRVVTPLSDVPEAASSSAPLSGRRERLACAEIGLEPSQRAFESCVSGLRDVLSANEMSALYRNP